MSFPKTEKEEILGIGGSQLVSRDMDLFYPESMKHMDFMDVDLHQHYHQQQPNTGLIRYRSAPSSFFKNFSADTGGGGVGRYEEFDRGQPTSTEESSETGFGDSRGLTQEGNWQNGYSTAAAAPLVFQRPQAAVQPPLRNHSSNLLRQSSSPPGILDNLAVEIGFSNGMESSFSMGGRNGDRDRTNSSKVLSRIVMPQIAEMGNLSTDPGFPIGSWDESPALSPLKKFGDITDGNVFSSFNERLETQDGGVASVAPALARHLSLPKAYSAGMGTPENVWLFQDSVPCRARAKRGCATHPRSIAERMRRTRISERMRKLQELFPNMDKQTNTADMLEVAVEYIKNLQKQVKTLMDSCARCTCSSREMLYSDRTP